MHFPHESGRQAPPTVRKMTCLLLGAETVATSLGQQVPLPGPPRCPPQMPTSQSPEEADPSRPAVSGLRALSLVARPCSLRLPDRCTELAVVERLGGV